jgi:alkylation response protein AidB-like acyl-CoA dehydrogenase
MDLEFAVEQRELKDAVRRFCTEQVTPQRLAAWQSEPRGIDVPCWQTIASLGWFGLGLPEVAGGSGQGLVEVACLLEECARGLIPRAVIGAIRGAWVLAGLNPAAPELAAVARGEQTVALAMDEEGARDPGHYQTRVERSGMRAVVRGAKWYVANGCDSDWQIVAARDGEDIVLGLLAGAVTERELLRTFDGERQSIVRYAGVPLVRELAGAGEGAARLARLRREQTALALAEMIGGMDGVLAMTVAYVKEREQFGRKIGAFQAVQHQIADMATDYTASRHLAWQAITRLAAGTIEGVELETAAAFVGKAFKRLTLTAHHLHGGAGYVVEHPLHYHAERAQSLCIRHAPEQDALRVIASRLLD